MKGGSCLHPERHLAVGPLPHSILDAAVWQGGLAENGMVIGDLVIVLPFPDGAGGFNQAEILGRWRAQLEGACAHDLTDGLQSTLLAALFHTAPIPSNEAMRL
jgi:hypothetical protein